LDGRRTFFDVAMTEKSQTFATITQAALADVWRYYGGSGSASYYWETYTSFGDPSMVFQTPGSKRLDAIENQLAVK
jgi:hypothetical protein